MTWTFIISFGYRGKQESVKKPLRIAAPLLWAFALLPGTLQAQVDSGPKAGSKVEILKAVAAIGDSAGKEVDYANDRKGKPTMFVFVQADKWDRPAARFLRALDQELAKSRDDVHIIAVWLTDDVEKAKEYLPKAQESLKLSQTIFAAYASEKGGPAGWGSTRTLTSLPLLLKTRR